MRYSHRQIGYHLVVVLSAGIIISFGCMIKFGYNWSSIICMILFAMLLLGFYSLRVVIDDSCLRLIFGIGYVRKKFELNKISSVRAVRNPWFYGWGIHLTPRGWLYNVSGFHAVEISMNTGEKFRVGTDAPDALAKEIRNSIRR